MHAFWCVLNLKKWLRLHRYICVLAPCQPLLANAHNSSAIIIHPHRHGVPVLIGREWTNLGKWWWELRCSKVIHTHTVICGFSCVKVALRNIWGKGKIANKQKKKDKVFSLCKGTHIYVRSSFRVFIELDALGAECCCLLLRVSCYM